MTIGSYKNLTRLLGQLADVNIKDAVTGDTLVRDSNGIWVAEAGGTNSGLTSVAVDSNYFTGNGTSTNAISLKSNSINHSNLANIDANTNAQHISATQLAKIHSALTTSQASNSAISFSLASNQVLSADIVPSNIDHSALGSLNTSNYNHLTSNQVSALHSAVTVSNASNAAVSLTLGSNQELSASFTGSNSDILSVPLTGFSASAGTIAATDNIVQAFNKAQGSITNLENINVRATRFATISSGTSGTITVPTNNTIVLDDFGGTVDAVITASSGGKPTGTPALDTNGAIVTTTLDTNGGYSLSGTPASYPVALVYRTRTKWINYDDTAADIAGDKEVESDHNALVNVQGGQSGQYMHLTASQHSIATAAATATNAGYVDTNTQSFGGAKTFSAITAISDTTVSSNASTGALVIAGGVGIGGAVNITGNLTASNVSGNNTGDETATSIATIIDGTTNKDVLVATDAFAIIDGTNNALKQHTWANMKTKMLAYIIALG